MAGKLHDILSTVLPRELPGLASVERCQQLSAGASQETWCIEVATEDGNGRLALRRAQPMLGEGGGVGQIPLETEATLFRLAGEHDVPGPTVRYILQPGDGLGAGFIMDWLDGETLGQRIVGAPELADARQGLARECGEILGRIHAIDWRAAGLQATLPVIEPAQLVEETWAAYRELDVPMPMIDYAGRWLVDNLPEASRQCLVHGDFRNGNLMVTPGGINAVLDWELAHIGDPVRDLGWLCVNSWRFGQRDKAVGGFGTIDDLLAGYAATSGINVTREELTFWQVFGSFWWAMATLRMAHTWRTGETPSLERPVIGRRSSEAQMDCINLLIPGDLELPADPAPDNTGTQLPMPAELVEGVVSFLRSDATATLQPHDIFLARVAANSLRIAQREIRLGPALAGAEQDRLQALLAMEGELDTLRRELVAQLRAELPLDTPGLAQHLRQTVACQLCVDQPRYSALLGP